MHDTGRTRAVLAVLLVLALALITLDYRDGSTGPVRSLRQAGGAVFGTVERTVSVIASPFTGFFSRSAGSGSGSQVAGLQREVLELRTELSQEQLSKADYRQLSSLLQLSGRGGYRVVAASVIAMGSAYAQTVTLDAGAADGVKTGDTVLNGQGLVGTVTAVSGQTCTVLLATDATAVVGVTLSPSGQIGWVTGPGRTGSGSGLLRLQVLDENAVLNVGEQLVTSASVRDRPYVPGVPVGVIAVVENQAGSLTPTALVRPYVNFTSLGVVGIVVASPAHNPRFSVLPPAPHAKPVPTVTVTVTAGASGSPSPSASGSGGG